MRNNLADYQTLLQPGSFKNFPNYSWDYGKDLLSELEIKQFNRQLKETPAVSSVSADPRSLNREQAAAYRYIMNAKDQVLAVIQ